MTFSKQMWPCTARDSTLSLLSPTSPERHRSPSRIPYPTCQFPTPSTTGRLRVGVTPRGPLGADTFLPGLAFSFTQLSAALMFDAVHVVVSAVRELNRSQEIGVKPLACTSANIWPHGTSLMNYLRMVSQKQGGMEEVGSSRRLRQGQ